jgi:hypothetical protein
MGILEIVGGLRKGSSVRGSSFLGILKDMERRDQGKDIIPHCHEGPFTGNSES